jgi:hypothetical protein
MERLRLRLHLEGPPSDLTDEDESAEWRLSNMCTYYEGVEVHGNKRAISIYSCSMQNEMNALSEVRKIELTGIRDVKSNESISMSWQYFRNSFEVFLPSTTRESIVRIWIDISFLCSLSSNMQCRSGFTNNTFIFVSLYDKNENSEDNNN